MDDSKAAPAPNEASLVSDTAHYLTEIQLAGDIAGFAFVYRLWRYGLAGQIALAALIGGAIATAYFLTQQPFGANPNPTISEPTVILSLVLFALGWAYAVAASVRLPLWGYVIVVVYVAWFGVAPIFGIGSPVLVTVPLFWLLGVGWLMLRASASRWRRGWFLLLCLGASYLTFSGFSLSRFFPGVWNLPARLALGGIYFGLLANPYVLRERAALPNAARLFWLTLALYGILLAALAVINPDALVQNEYTVLESMLALVGLVWMLLSFGAFDGAVKTGEWSVRVSKKLLVRRDWRIVFVIAWIVLTLYESPITYSYILPSLVFVNVNLALALNNVLSGSLYSLSYPIYFAMQLHQYVGAAVMIASIILAVQKKFTAQWLARLNGVWIGSFLLFVVLASAEFAFRDVNIQAGTSLPLEATLLLLVGIVWELVKSGADWTEGNEPRLFGVIALLLLTLVISTFLFGIGDNELTHYATLYAFLGILFLGIPYLLLTFFAKQTHYEPIGGIQLAALFGLGWIGTLPLVIWNPNPSWHLLLAPLWWIVVLALLGTRVARLALPLDGVIAGATLALGFATFWIEPEAVFVPFVSAIVALEQPIVDADMSRDVLDINNLWFVLGAVAIGAIIGFIFVQMMRPAPSARNSTTN